MAKKIISGVFQVLIGVGAMILAQIIAYLTNKMQFVKNCTYNGEILSSKKFNELLVERMEACVLDSDAGKIILCHGNPDGSFMINLWKQGTYQDLIEYLNLEPGEYKILSCFNGKRDDFIKNGYKINRFEMTKTPFPTMGAAWNGTLRMCSSRFGFQAILMLATPIWKWNKISEAIEKNIRAPKIEHEETTV